MTADTAAVLAGALATTAAVVTVVAVVLLGRRLRELRRLVDQLRSEALPLVREARVVVDQAATEMVRVTDVLGSAEAVSATVDSASRLAYRAFANPLVKVVAFGSGFGGALRRLAGRPPRRRLPDGVSAADRSRRGVEGPDLAIPGTARHDKGRRRLAHRRRSEVPAQ
ncbi:MAG TPA: hypothetical protein VMV14_08110 [Acidimicrobiales bacterium]|nr:hypothetical protein [Acidimicrobiales bacterium]